MIAIVGQDSPPEPALGDMHPPSPSPLTMIGVVATILDRPRREGPERSIVIVP
jgi:hypothetical protein